jgi:hypothetical protein
LADRPLVQFVINVESVETAKPGKKFGPLELVPPPPLNGLPTPPGGVVATAGGLKTETIAQVCAARRLAGTVAVIWVVLTLETARLFWAPSAFQRTWEPPDGSDVGMNCLPVRLRVSVGLPGAALPGVKPSSSGRGLGAGLITKLRVLERPLSVLPECGFSVLTWARPGWESRDASTVAVRVRTVLLASVVTCVGIVLPFHCTTVLGTKPRPKRFRVKVPVLTLAFDGAMEDNLAPVGA